MMFFKKNNNEYDNNEFVKILNDFSEGNKKSWESMDYGNIDDINTVFTIGDLKGLIEKELYIHKKHKYQEGNDTHVKTETITALTALHAAIFYEDKKEVQALLEKGCDLNVTCGTRGNRRNILYDNSQSVNFTDSYTALELAKKMYGDDDDIVELLEKHINSKKMENN